MALFTRRDSRRAKDIPHDEGYDNLDDLCSKYPPTFWRVLGGLPEQVAEITEGVEFKDGIKQHKKAVTNFRA